MRVLLIAILALPLFAQNPTEEIARKLTLLEREIAQHPTALEIPYDPFHPRAKTVPHAAAHHTVRKRIKRGVSLEVTMILNKKAFINGRWVKENQKIADYVVKRIDQDTVFLKRGRKIIKLSLSKGDSLLIAKEEK